MRSFPGQNLFTRFVTVFAVGGLLCIAATLAGCNKDNEAPATPPPAAANGGGAPPQTAEQKAAEDAARAQSSAIRQQHAPSGPK